MKQLLWKATQVVAAILFIAAIGVFMAVLIMAEDPWFYGENGVFSKPPYVQQQRQQPLVLPVQEVPEKKKEDAPPPPRDLILRCDVAGK